MRGRSAPSPVEPTEPGQDDVSATSQLPKPVESRALVPRKRRVPSVQDYSRAVVSAPRLLAFFFFVLWEKYVCVVLLVKRELNDWLISSTPE